MKKIKLYSCLVLLVVAWTGQVTAQQFAATPLIDQPTGFYEPGTVKFELGLYKGTNVLKMASPAHDAKLTATSAAIAPLCRNGLAAAPTCAEGGTGRIGVVHIGLSVTIEQTCTGLIQHGPAPAAPSCSTGTADNTFYFVQQGPKPSVNPLVRFADCADEGGKISQWASDYPSGPLWTDCAAELTGSELARAQIQGVTIEPVAGSPNGNPLTMSSLTHTPCKAGDEGIAACYAEQQLGIVLRDLKVQYPNLKIAYVYSRAYGGWGSAHEPNREPFSYEFGFSIQFLMLAQIRQADNGQPADSEAGDLSYGVAPVLSWGGYQWASGNTPNSEGVAWPITDFAPDLVHYSTTGYPNSANTMIDFFLGTDITGLNHINYTTWFRSKTSKPGA